MKQQGFVELFYPLHDNEALKKLGSQWYLSLFGNQPYGAYLTTLHLTLKVCRIMRHIIGLHITAT